MDGGDEGVVVVSWFFSSLVMMALGPSPVRAQTVPLVLGDGIPHQGKRMRRREMGRRSTKEVEGDRVNMLLQ